MGYYFCLVFLILFFCFIRFKIVIKIGAKRKAINFALFGSQLILFLFAAFRGDGSGDYWAYLERGSQVKTFSDIFDNTTHLNTGYSFLAWIVNLFHFPSQVVVAMMNLISITAVGIIIKRFSTIPALSILVFLPFYFQFDMHAARTAVAISLVTLTIPYIIEKKFLRFLLVIIIASIFHPSALIAVGLWFAPDIKIDRTLGIVLVTIAAIFAKLNWVEKTILFIFNKIHFNYGYQILISYIDSQKYGYALKLYDPRILLLILIFVLSRYGNGENCAENRYRRFLRNTCFIAALIMVCFSQRTFFAYRLSAFYNIFTILLVPFMCKDLSTENGYVKHFNRQYYYASIILYFLLALIYSTKLLPYKLCNISYWQ